MNYTERLLKAIPGGAHTYSRGYDQFPLNAPQILKRGQGAYVFDAEENKFLDYGMALRANILGYADQDVNDAVIKAINLGNNLTRPSLIELEAAELLINLIESAEMVKFAKNGSNVTTAAVKLARAYTGRKYIARCSEHPFFSFDDWFIGSTPMTLGIPDEISKLTLQFKYNDLQDLQNLFEQYPNQIACVIMEAATTEHPAENYLQNVIELCHKNGTVFILDEMITGFRWNLQGAQKYYNIKPDLSTFGKAMANGFSVAALLGKKEIMKLGSIEFENQERLFLLSTTHGAEMSSLAAFIATANKLKTHNVIEHIWNYGRKFIKLFNDLSKSYGIEEYLYSQGIECSPYFVTKDENKQISLSFRTLFIQELIKNNVLMPWIAFSYSHRDAELAFTEEALYNSMRVYKQALENGIESYLVGHSIKPVFRKYN